MTLMKLTENQCLELKFLNNEYRTKNKEYRILPSNSKGKVRYSIFCVRCSLFIFLFFLTQNLQAQKGISIEPTLHFGSIVKHTKELTYDVKSMTIGADINLKFQTYGKKEWHQWQRFPLFGVALYYMNYGDWKTLGHTFSISPNVTVPLFKKEKWNGHFQIGTGVAYSNRKFDYLENPTNNALGSNWNSTVAMKFYASRQIHSNYKMHLGLSFTHYSNGAARLPNFGINIPALMLGINYTPQPLQSDDYIFH